MAHTNESSSDILRSLQQNLRESSLSEPSKRPLLAQIDVLLTRFSSPDMLLDEAEAERSKVKKISLLRANTVKPVTQYQPSPRRDAESYEKLPESFGGANNLTMPPYLPSRSSGVTLPSRLAGLGTTSFVVLAALRAFDIGHSVVGYTLSPLRYIQYVFCNCFGCGTGKAPSNSVSKLVVLPNIFSKHMAQIQVFFCVVALMIFGALAVNGLQIYTFNIGRAWAIGTTFTVIVEFLLSKMKTAPDGVMPFCRSMGVPEVEEMMFSYSWAVEEENIRTLAKAMWNAGVGVWIDVIKLCPGDEIRPVLRTMVRHVRMCVVFMSPEYANSPNCCVEFWEAVQYPEKLIICIMRPMSDSAMEYLHGLTKAGTIICEGLDALLPILDSTITNTEDIRSYEWWKSQRISSGGVPDSIVPTKKWPIPRFRVCGRISTPSGSLVVGPTYLSGDCRETGEGMRLPWLFLLALFALGCNGFDIFLKAYAQAIQRTEYYTPFEWTWLGMMALLNFAPFVAFSALFETRFDCAPSLKPLLASKAVGEGVRIKVIGSENYVGSGQTSDETVANTLRAFLDLVGHNADQPQGYQVEVKSVSQVAPTPISEMSQSKAIRVHVMSCKAHRDAVFSTEQMAFDPRTELFVWVGQGSPFTADGGRGAPDAAGVRMMRFLCLVAEWEGENLAESLFSAVGVRVVDVLHT